MSLPNHSDLRGRLRGHLARAATATGPVSFLNPTTRYVLLQGARRHAHRHTGHEEGPPGDLQGGRWPGLTRSHTAPAAYHVWRSRDNRKGRHALLISRRLLENREKKRIREKNEGQDSKDSQEGKEGQDIAVPQDGHATAAEVAAAEGAAAAAAATATKADGPLDEDAEPPRPSNSPREICRGLVKMVVCYPVWDISYDVAVLYTLGSAIWIINAFFAWLPLQSPSTEFHNETTWGCGITGVVGATVFEVGAILGMLEALNENTSDCFGWALEEAWGSHTDLLVHRLRKPGGCLHHHAERQWLLSGRWARKNQASCTESMSSVEYGSAGSAGSAGSGGGGGGGGAEVIHGVPAQNSLSGDQGHLPGGHADAHVDANVSDANVLDIHDSGLPRRFSVSRRLSAAPRRWSWCPSWEEVRTHYCYELGFWACAVQLAGATIFWISGVTGLPPIINHISTATENGVYWVPQVVGGVGFIVSSLLFTLETQTAWYRPSWGLLGWHIGMWNLVGSIGFTLCGAFGFASAHSNMNYAATLSTFIGSWAFLIGSTIQWYESLDKYPVSIQDTLPGEKAV